MISSIETYATQAQSTPHPAMEEEERERADAECSKDKRNRKTTVSNGYLGSCNDEERSKMRYVM